MFPVVSSKKRVFLTKFSTTWVTVQLSFDYIITYTYCVVWAVNVQHFNIQSRKHKPLWRHGSVFHSDISQIQWHVNTSWYRDVNSAASNWKQRGHLFFFFSSNHHVWAQLNLSYQPVTKELLLQCCSVKMIKIFTLTYCAWHASDRTARKA